MLINILKDCGWAGDRPSDPIEWFKAGEKNVEMDEQRAERMIGSGQAEKCAEIEKPKEEEDFSFLDAEDSKPEKKKVTRKKPFKKVK